MPDVERKKLPWRSMILFAIALAATFVFLAIADELREGDLDDIDTQIAIAVHQHQASVLDVIMIMFTKIGTGPVLIGAIAAVAFWSYKRGRNSYILILAANTIIAMGVNPVLKQIFARARPTLFEVIKRPDTFSFPSGHSMSAVVIYGALATVIIALRPTAKVPVLIGAVILILGIGFSRVYLGAHWPMDVLAGWASGVPFLIATVHIVHRAKRGEAT
jgi:membrane-associated phospholipid phosphatase